MNTAQYIDGDPIKRFVLLVLFQAQQDHATEMVVEPTISERSPIRYKVEGTWYDLAPPPPHILAGVVAELERLGQLGEGEFPREGIIDVRLGAGRLHWRIRMTTAEAGYILVPIEG